MAPAIITATRKFSYPNCVTANRTIAINPAAGPDTLTLELLNAPTRTPPIIPAIIPANGGAPLATAMPKQRGKATKKTTIPDNRSARLNEKEDLIATIFCREKRNSDVDYN
jgi:hypothetical protein